MLQTEGRIVAKQVFKLFKKANTNGQSDQALKALAALAAEFLSYSTARERYQMLVDHPELLEPQSEKVMHFAVYDSGQVPRHDQNQVWQYVSGMLSDCRQHGAGVLLLSHLLYHAWSKGTESLRHAIENAANPPGQEFHTSNILQNQQRIKLQEELAAHPDLAQFGEARACLLRQNVDMYMALFQATGDSQLAYRACDSIVALGSQCTKKDSYERCLYFILAASREHLVTAQTAPLDNAINECLKLLPQYDENTKEFSALHMQVGSLFVDKARQTGSVSDLEAAIMHLMVSIKGNLKPSSKVTALSYLGTAETELFKRTQRAEILESSISNLRHAVSTSVSQSIEQCDARMNLALALKEKFGKTKQAALMEEALQLLENCADNNNPGYEIDGAVRLDNLGTTLREYSEHLYFSGAIDEAIKMLDHCIEIQKQALALVESGKGPQGYLYGFLSNLGIALKDRTAFITNDSDLAAAVEYLERALALIAPEAAFRFNLLNNLAMCYISLYLRSEDPKFLDQAIATMQKSAEKIPQGSTEQIEYLHRLGSYQAHRFQRTNQSSDLDESIKVLEQAWRVAQETLNWSAVAYKLGQQIQNKSIHGLLIDLYLRKADLGPETAKDAWIRALEVNESSKSGVLLAMLNYQELPAPEGIPTKLVEEEHRYLQVLSDIERRQLQSYGVVESAKSSLVDVNQLNQHRAVLGSLNELWNKMEGLGPYGSDYVRIRRGHDITWTDISTLAKHLGEGTALISLFTELENITIFVVKAGEDAPHVVRVPSNNLQLDEFMRNFQAEIINWHAHRADSKPFTHEWQKLGISLFAPIMHFLEGVKHITISPHGPLHALPLHALFTDESGRCLIDDFSISYTPAFGPLFSLSNKQPIESLDSLIFGYTPNVSERPIFIGEAESIAKITHGKIAVNKAATATSLQQYSKQPLKVMHFSCHGAFDKQNPLHSAILLADGGFTIRSWLALQLQADLVTLSACQLAQSASLGGEEMAGFVQAILISGGRSALLGLWNVNAFITKELMERFYRNWFNKDLSMTKAQALRQAVLELRNSEAAESLTNAGISPSDPYLWAPFCLHGI
jgi:CHAT domain-containing protein